MARPRASKGAANKKATSKRGSKAPRDKVGSSPKSAKTFGGKTDFGVEQKPRLAEFSKRKSREAKFTPAGSHTADPRQEIGATQAARVSGVGKANAGPGGASGGDIDPDVVGVGDGRALAQSGPDEKVWGPEWTTGGSEEMASGPPAKGENQGAKPGPADESKPRRGKRRQS
jgi:hypothetical protein